MNASPQFDAAWLWQIAGWTMLHFLWLGALVGVVAGVCRLLLRRRAPAIRYATAVALLLVLAMMPLAIAGWLVATESPAFIAAAPISDEIIELSGRSLAPPIDSPSALAPFAPGFDAGFAPTGDNEITPAESPPAITSSVTAAETPGQSWGLTDTANDDALPRDVLVAALRSCVQYLPWLWVIGTPLTFAMLATGLVGTRRLQHASRPVVDGPVVEMLARLAESLRIGTRVGIAVCDRVAAPVLVGILRPIILLPPAALTGWSPDEIEMVLLHELAHVRRWDNLINLAQRIVESLLFFHPVVWLVSTWIRREREACCDALVVHRTNRPHAYAELLVALAAQLPRSVLFQPAATSAMAAGPLRKRIHRILQLEDDPMLVSGKSLMLALASLLVAATLAVLYLPAIGQAEEAAGAGEAEVLAEAEELTTKDTESTEAELADVNNDRTEPAKPDAITEKLSDIDFVTPQDLMTSIQALNTLGLKVAPAREAELKQVQPLGYDGGLKLLEFEHFPHLKEPFILTEFSSKAISTGIASFKDLQRALDAVAAKPGDGLFVITGVAKGGGKFTYQGRTTERSAALARAHLKFPSLEDQKLADLAYKQLGLELEAVGDDDLKRVRALGYDGGLKVTAGAAGTGGAVIQFGDILVGLHVWPTASMQALAEVLERDDLADLNPLKFYAIYQRLAADSDPNNPTIEDAVRTGRVSVQIGGGFGGGGGGFGGGRSTSRNAAPTLPSRDTADSASQPESPQPRSTGQGAPSPLQPAASDRTVVAYNVPNELRDDLRQYRDATSLRGIWDDRDRFVVQATAEQHKQLKSLLEATAKWRATRGGIRDELRQRGGVIVQKKMIGDEEVEVLEWPTAGLTFARETRPEYPGVVVVEVAPGSPAAWQDIRPGDIMGAMDGFYTSSLAELESVIKTLLSGFPSYEKQVDVPFRRVSDRGVQSFRKKLPLRLDSASNNSGPPWPTRAAEQRRAQTPSAPQTDRNAPATHLPSTAPAPKPAGLQFYFFHHEDSQPSHAMKPLVERIANVPPGAQFIEVDVERMPDLTKQMNIDRVPTLVITRDGKELGRLIGKQSEQQLRDAIAGILTPTKSTTGLAAAEPTASISQTLQPPTPSPPPTTPTTGTAGKEKANLRYEGKTFEEWREAWRTELSNEKRIEAIRALAAFGANGYGREAAEAILEIAQHYDWQRVLKLNRKPNELQAAVLDALLGSDNAIQMIPATDWFPLVLEGIKSSDDSLQQLSRVILRNVTRLGTNPQLAGDSLFEVTRSNDASLRRDALIALMSLNRRHENQQIIARLKELLGSGDSQQILDALECVAFSNTPLPFDASDLLFHGDEQVRRAARRAIRYLRPKQDQNIGEFLLEALKNPAVYDQVATIRALASFGESAAPAYAELEKLMTDRNQPMPVRVAAMKAMERVENQDSNGYPLLELFGNENKDRQETPEFRAEYQQLKRAIQNEG